LFSLPRNHAIEIVRRSGSIPGSAGGGTHLLPDGHYTIWIVVGKRSHQDGVDRRNNGGCSADAERQCENGGDGEAWRAAQRPHGLPRIGPDRFEHHATSNVDIASIHRQPLVRVRKQLSARSDDGNVVGTLLALVRPSNARFESKRRVETEE